MDLVCIKGREWNEDYAYANDEFYFVIDGATSLTTQKFSKEATDAKWFAKNLCKFLKTALLDKSKNLTQILKLAIIKLKQDYLALSKNNVVIDMPSAAICVCRKNNNKLEYFVLGDCGFLIKTPQYIKDITTTDIAKLDKRDIDTMIQLSKQTNISILEARKKIADQVLAKRLSKNTPNGYYIISDDPNACDHAVCGEIDIEDNTQIVLYSDGFSQIWDTVYKYSISKVFDLLNSGYKLKQIVKDLRTIQQLDKDCNDYPRFKKSDDSSAIYVKFN